MMILRSKGWKKTVFSIVLALLAALVQTAITCNDCLQSPEYFLRYYFIAAILWVSLSQFNSWVAVYSGRKGPWLHSPGNTFLLTALAHSVVTLAVVFTVFLLVKLLYGVWMDKVWVTASFSIGITFIISFFLYGRKFLLSWRQLELDAERLRSEHLTSKYESLKNQVNPHFLFNSLNALTDLVYENQDLAAKFIRKLSEVYRYVLDQQDKKTVLLEEELKFAEAYIFLQKIRFGEKLKVENTVSPNEQYYVPPLSIQMLLENAIKHNIITKEQPLTIQIIIKGEDKIRVSNNLQKKNSLDTSGSNQLGLANIKARYRFLTEKTVEITENKEVFEVLIPLIIDNKAPVLS